jgi:hypothetical protein
VEESFWEFQDDCKQKEIERRFKSQREPTAHDSMQYYGQQGSYRIPRGSAITKSSVKP